MKVSMTRRGVTGAAAASMALTQSSFAWGQDTEITRAVSTRAGRVRGHRADGVSRFLGIPYGADTSTRRFQPALPAPAWRGVRDCFDFGGSSPQAGGMPGGQSADPQRAQAYLGIYMSGIASRDRPRPESENCLVLNVWTPDASSARRRPVMFYLHGGGFAQGSGSAISFDGAALCRRGDVVVVTINHRLNAMGYLYLGALHNDFADSGNVGQLDQVLALQWVRDNIAAFGGDPGNVTIFGQSGGGAKVSTLLAMPAARGLFHKAIIQSGPGLRMITTEAATTHAERTLAALNVARADVHRLQTMDTHQIIQAAASVQGGGRPVVDGRALPRHPFDPDAPETARNIPLLIGTCKDEVTLFNYLAPDFDTMTVDQARQRFEASLGARAGAAFELYRHRRPNDAPTYWYTSQATDSSTWINSIKLAERKFAQQAGPVYMYRLDWETPVLGGALRTPHGLDTALAFDNAQYARNLVGPGPVPDQIGAEISQAFISFARNGDPSQQGLAWPSYNPQSRQTMIFLPQSHVVSDPDSDVRRFFST